MAVASAREEKIKPSQDMESSFPSPSATKVDADAVSEASSSVSVSGTDTDRVEQSDPSVHRRRSVEIQVHSSYLPPNFHDNSISKSVFR